MASRLALCLRVLSLRYCCAGALCIEAPAVIGTLQCAICLYSALRQRHHPVQNQSLLHLKYFQLAGRASAKQPAYLTPYGLGCTHSKLNMHRFSRPQGCASNHIPPLAHLFLSHADSCYVCRWTATTTCKQVLSLMSEWIITLFLPVSYGFLQSFLASC